jgi:hypothetical protein
MWRRRRKKLFYRPTQPTDSLMRHKCVQLRSFFLFNKNKNVQYRDIESALWSLTHAMLFDQGLVWEGGESFRRENPHPGPIMTSARSRVPGTSTKKKGKQKRMKIKWKKKKKRCWIEVPNGERIAEDIDNNNTMNLKVYAVKRGRQRSSCNTHV